MNVMGAVAGIETIVPEAGVAVLVLIITENVGEADMMMRGVVEVDLMEGIAGVVFFFFLSSSCCHNFPLSYVSVCV